MAWIAKPRARRYSFWPLRNSHWVCGTAVTYARRMAASPRRRPILGRTSVKAALQLVDFGEQGLEGRPRGPRARQGAGRRASGGRHLHRLRGRATVGATAVEVQSVEAPPDGSMG